MAQATAQQDLDVGLGGGAVGIVVDPCALGVARAPPYGVVLRKRSSVSFGSGTHLMVRALISLRAAKKSDTMCR